MEARTPEVSEAGAKRAAGGTLTTCSAGKRVCPSGCGAAAGATSATSKSDICQHQREWSTCKECGGASICQHLRQRNRWSECGGASICQHQRQRNKCKECRDEADTSMPAGLEELARAAHADREDL